MSKCKECGSEIAEGAKFCGECGAKVPVQNKCPTCGVSCPIGAKFCAECGHQLEVTSSTVEKEESEFIRQLKNGMVNFTVEKLGFHKIKALKLLQTEFNCTVGNWLDGTCHWMVDPDRAKTLKQKFEEIGAMVSIRVYSKKDIESFRLASEEPEFAC